MRTSRIGTFVAAIALAVSIGAAVFLTLHSNDGGGLSTDATVQPSTETLEPIVVVATR